VAALVTGGGSGLGRELCVALASRGLPVVVADRDLGRAAETLGLLAGPGHRAESLDVADADSWAALKARLDGQGIRIDWLANNAGVASGGEMAQVAKAEWDRVIAINLTGVYLGVATFAAEMAAAGRGKILNVASFAGLAGTPLLGAYGVSKAGVIALSESLRVEMAARGVSVHVLCPSFFQTRLLQSAGAGTDPRVLGFAQRQMQKGQLSAAEVADYTLAQMDRGRFLLLPHREARWYWRLKRLLPSLYFRQLLQAWTAASRR
jgi:NAD(P)-dependent dehydrogenase (short-subunit alcohol dehydrogenase family)